mgnify:FL=1
MCAEIRLLGTEQRAKKEAADLKETLRRSKEEQ